MRLLLDTHACLWLFNFHEKLSENVRQAILDINNELFISVVFPWEVAIKHSIGKVTDFPDGVFLFYSEIIKNNITVLPVTEKSIECIESLEMLHRDPFDRMIIATAKELDLTIITKDENIQKYDVKWLW